MCVFQRSVFLLVYLCLSALAVEPSLTPSLPLLSLSFSRHLSHPLSLPLSLPLTPSSLTPGLSHCYRTASPLSLLSPTSLSHATYVCPTQVEIRKSTNVSTNVECPVAPANWTTNQIICTVPAGAGKGQHLVQTRPSPSRPSFLAFFVGDGHTLAISLWCMPRLFRE